MNIVHISIDDVIYVFKELTDTKPSSIFDLHFFRYFKRLHDKYGAVVSCYCFYLHDDFTLASCTRNYKTEFEANSDWLRFGFHGYSGKEDYGIQGEMESEKQYELVMGNLTEIVGIKALDTTTRIHRFQAAKAFMMYMMHAKYPTHALFGADDNRLSYSLSVAENNQLLKHGIYNMNNMLIMRTTQRFDSVKPLSICRLFTHFRGGEVFFHTRVAVLPNDNRDENKGNNNKGINSNNTNLLQILLMLCL